MGYGFVEFEEAAAAQLAIRRMMNTRLDGRTLMVIIVPRR